MFQLLTKLSPAMADGQFLYSWMYLLKTSNNTIIVSSPTYTLPSVAVAEYEDKAEEKAADRPTV